jgi:inosine-uridine nucleoside N-ribohydrolase
LAHPLLGKPVNLRPLLGLALLAALASPAAAARQKVILDQDAFGPGGSNLQAILMMVQDPHFEVLGVTMVSGDGWAKENAAHTLRMLELMGRPDIPVIVGASYPLINSEEETKRWEALYGRLVYKGAWMDTGSASNSVDHPHHHGADFVPPLREGEPTTRALPGSAAEFIVRKVRQFPGQVVILAMGPFTNLALAAAIDNDVPALAQGLVIMGGCFDPDGSSGDEFAQEYVNNPRVEFNFRWDPEAGRMMLHAGWKSIVVIPTDATVGTRYTAAMNARATAGSSTPAALYLAHFADIGFPMWDEVSAAVLIDPTIVKRSDRLAMDIEIDHGPNYGATLSWNPKNAPGLGEPIVTVVRSVDIPRLEAMFVAAVRRPPQSP